MVHETRPRPRKKEPRAPKDGSSPFELLSKEIYLKIIKELSYVDGFCFGLTNQAHFQHFKSITTRSLRPSFDELKVICLRLQKGWVPKDLKW